MQSNECNELSKLEPLPEEEAWHLFVVLYRNMRETDDIKERRNALNELREASFSAAHGKGGVWSFEFYYTRLNESDCAMVFPTMRAVSRGLRNFKRAPNQ